jgi:hypothetical protein
MGEKSAPTGLEEGIVRQRGASAKARKKGGRVVIMRRRYVVGTRGTHRALPHHLNLSGGLYLW